VNTWVQRCLDFLRPWLRKRDLPLLVAAPGAFVPLELGFPPERLWVTIFTPVGGYSTAELSPSATAWDVPEDLALPTNTYLAIFATRLFQGYESDFARYIARLRIR
jgi:hypothetical protein